MNHTSNGSEAASKKPSITESVESLIAKKKAEQADKGAQAVQQSADAVKGEVADVMAGVEAPKEYISEKAGENKGDGDFKGGGAGQSDDGAGQSGQGIMQYIFPGEDLMIRRVRSAIEFQIKIEEKRAKKLEKNLMNGSAQEYNSAIARIRRLKEVLASLLTATVEVIKGIYQKYFTARGMRKPLREIE